MASPEHTSPVWEKIGTLVTDGQLSLSDSSYFYDEALLVAVPPGSYSVMVRYGTRDGKHYVRALRVAHDDNLLRGPRLGEVIVDFAQVAVCDRGTTENAFDALGDSGMKTYYDKLQTLDLTSTVALSNDVSIFIVRSGLGDGAYPVYELGSSRHLPAGVEIDFAPPSD